MIRNDEQLTQALVKAAAADVPVMIRRYGGDVYSKWNRFLEDYGYMGMKEFELFLIARVGSKTRSFSKASNACRELSQ